MGKSLIETFRSLNPETKNILADFSSPLLLSFATLSIAHEQAGVDQLSAEHIIACLEAAGVSVKRKSVARALARAKDRVSTTKGIEGETLYRLMTKGYRDVAAYLGGGQISILRIESGKPRTAHVKLRKILSTLQGPIRICDPYYGIRTLESLDYIPTVKKVKFLTAKTNEAGYKLSGALRDFKKERPNVEFRKITIPSDIHDRYVVTKKQLLILGHGLKDIGGKESFMICMASDLVPDLIKEIISAFDSRWNIATPI